MTGDLDTDTTAEMLTRLRRLHKPGTWSSHCVGDIRICAECGTKWPCQTSTILGDNE